MSRAELDKHLAQLPLLGEQESRELNAGALRSKRRARLIDSGVIRVITPQARDFVMANKFPIETDALDKMRRFEYGHRLNGEEAANTFVVTGERGRGKTVSVAWLLATPERERNGRPLAGDVRMYMTSERLRLAHVGRTQDFERACGARILAVDELGTEGSEREEALSAPMASASAQSALLELITYRTGLGLSLTVLISNVAKEVLLQRYDARTIDKINERAKWAVVAGPNLRVPLEREESKP